MYGTFAQIHICVGAIDSKVIAIYFCRSGMLRPANFLTSIHLLHSMILALPSTKNRNFQDITQTCSEKPLLRSTSFLEQLRTSAPLHETRLSSHTS